MSRLTEANDPWGESSTDAPVWVDSTGPGLAMLATAPKKLPFELPASELAQLESRLKDLFDLDDFTGALAVTEKILHAYPDHVFAKTVREHSRMMLIKMYEAKIGDRTKIPQVFKSAAELIWLDLDHRSGFVLSHVDGLSSYEEIIEVTGMDPLESYRILAKLVGDGVIGAP